MIFPGACGRRRGAKCFGVTATACSSSTGAEKAGARATPIFGWAGDRDLIAGVRVSSQGRPDVDPERIGGYRLSVGGEIMLGAAAQSTAFNAIVSEGASGRSGRDASPTGADMVGFMATHVTLATASSRTTVRRRPVEVIVQDLPARSS